MSTQPTEPTAADTLADLADAEALALSRCYALARARARQIREQKTLPAALLEGAAAGSAEQGDPERRPTYEQG